MSKDHEGRNAETASDSLNLERGMEIVARFREAACDSESLHAGSMLHTIIRNMQEVVLLLDRDLRVLEANRAYSREFGSSVKLRRGVHIEEALPRAAECGITDLLNSALESEKAVQVKCFKYDGLPRGTTYWNGSAVPVRIHGQNGLELSLAMVLVDVTEEVVAQDRLAEIAMLRERRARESEAERARLDAIIQSTPIPLAVFDTDGRVVTCNSAALALSDIVGVSDWMRGLVTVSEIAGFVMTDVDGNEVSPEEDPVARSLRGEVCTGETVFVGVGARPMRAMNANSAPLRDAQGNVTGAVLALEDVTEQIRAQRQVDEIYQREHAIAEKLQSSLLPGEFPRIDGFEIGERYHSALDEALVGGDFYDIFRIGDEQLGIVIADVAGKGLKAAVYTAMTKYMLRAYALEDSAPERVLARLNEALTECTPVEIFVTLVYGVLDGRTGVFRYANAGHEQPVLYSSSAGMAHNLDVTGRALAFVHGSTYTACDVVMRPGDLLALYTDGITDAGSGINRMGVDRLLRIVESEATRSAPDVANAVLNTALEFSGGRLTDDAALVMIKAVLQAAVEE